MLRRPPELLVVLKHGGLADYKAAARLRVGGLDVWPMHRLSMLVRGGINDPAVKRPELIAPTPIPSSSSPSAPSTAKMGNTSTGVDLLSNAEQELVLLEQLLPHPRGSRRRTSAEQEVFELQAPYALMGDQPKAVTAICAGVDKERRFQTLLGATGTGKTFMMANVIEHTQRPTLVLAPNKVLAAQLYNELSAFFPDNAVEYFVSFYDYYLPESYSAASDTCE
jgi:hypothetical protein